MRILLAVIATLAVSGCAASPPTTAPNNASPSSTASSVMPSNDIHYKSTITVTVITEMGTVETQLLNTSFARPGQFAPSAADIRLLLKHYPAAAYQREVIQGWLNIKNRKNGNLAASEPIPGGSINLQQGTYTPPDTPVTVLRAQSATTAPVRPISVTVILRSGSTVTQTLDATNMAASPDLIRQAATEEGVRRFISRYSTSAYRFDAVNGYLVVYSTVWQNTVIAQLPLVGGGTLNLATLTYHQ